MWLCWHVDTNCISRKFFFYLSHFCFLPIFNPYWVFLLLRKPVTINDIREEQTSHQPPWQNTNRSETFSHPLYMLMTIFSWQKALFKRLFRLLSCQKAFQLSPTGSEFLFEHKAEETSLGSRAGICLSELQWNELGLFSQQHLSKKINLTPLWANA